MRNTIIGVLSTAILVILFGLSGAIAAPKIGELYKNAEDAYENGYYLKAIDRYKAALIKSEQKIHEINKKIEFLHNSAKMASGKKAVEEYKKTLEASQEGSVTEIEKLCMEAEIANNRNDSKIEKLNKEAEVYWKNKKYQTAIGKYELALRKNKENSIIFFSDYQTAIDKYREALKKTLEGDPKDSEKEEEVNREIKSIFYEGETNSETGLKKEDLLRAIDKYNPLVDEKETKLETDGQPKNSSEKKINDYKDALEDIQQMFDKTIGKYQKALKLSQENRITETKRRYKEAEIDYEIGNYELALRKYRAAASEARKETARLHKNFNILARYKIALCYTNLANKAADIETLLQEGDNAYRAGNYSISAKIYEKALDESRKEIAKNNGEAQNLRDDGNTAHNGGNYKEAFDKYTDVIKKSREWGIKTDTPKNAEKSFKEKQYQEAADQYKTALVSTLNQWSVDTGAQEEEYFYSTALKYIDEINTVDLESTLDDYQEGLVYLEAYIEFVQEEDDTKLEKFIKDFPNSRFRPEALFITGDIDKLLEEFPDFPVSNEARFRSAQQNFQNNKFEEAYKNYRKFLDSFPEDDSQVEESKYRSLYCRLQLILQGKPLNGENLDTLLNDYKSFTNENRNSKFLAIAYFDIGNIYLKQKDDYDEASSNFGLAVEKANADTKYSEMIPIAVLGKAHSDYKRNKIDEVISYLDGNKANVPTEGELRDNYDNLLKITRNSTHLTGIWNLSDRADEEFEQGNYSTAASIYKQVYDESDAPTLQEVRMLKFRAKFREGLSYFKLSRFRECVPAYQQAIQYFKDYIGDNSQMDALNNCRYNLTVAYEKLENCKTALESYIEIQNNPATIQYYDSVHHDLLIGISSNVASDKESAYQRVINGTASESDKNVARINLAKIYFDTQRYDKAAKLYAQVEGNAEAQYMAIVSYYNHIFVANAEPDAIDSNIEAVFQELRTNNPNSELVLPAISAMMQIYGKFEQWQQMIELGANIATQFSDLSQISANRFSHNDLAQYRTDIDRRYGYANTKRNLLNTVDDQIANIRLINITENPQEEARIQLKLGDILYKAKRYEGSDGAIAEYKKLINGFSNFSSNNQIAKYIRIAEYQVASCYYQLGHDPEKSDGDKINYYNQSIATAQKILDTLSPDLDMQVNIHYLSGRAHLMEGIPNVPINKPEAIRHFKRIVALEAGNPTPKTYGANLRLAQLYFDTAIGLIESH